MIRRKKKAKSAKRPKSAPMSAMVRKLDAVFSRFIRMKSADEGGTVTCVTCGKLLHWKEAHACHFVSRRHMSLRWDERNVNPGCARCNVFEHGALEEYSRYIIDTHGRETFDALLAAKREVKKWTRDDLAGLIAQYEQSVKEQARRLSYES